MSGQENDNEIAATSRVWCVLHVKPRTEKKVDDILAHRKCWHYLPLYKKIRKVNKRKVVSLLPLFPGYVFARLNSEERSAMRKTDKIANIIFDPNPRNTIHQLRQLKRVLQGAPRIRTAKLFTVGERVRVTEGPFMNSEGIIFRDQGKSSLALNMSILGQSIIVTIDPNICERIDTEKSA